MGIVALLMFGMGFVTGSFLGILILGFPMRRQQLSLRELIYCAAICLLLSGLMAFLSLNGLSASQLLATSSLSDRFQNVFDAFGSMGSSLGLGLTGIVGFCARSSMKASRKP
jgi:hypothetical protein